MLIYNLTIYDYNITIYDMPLFRGKGTKKIRDKGLKIKENAKTASKRIIFHFSLFSFHFLL